MPLLATVTLMLEVQLIWLPSLKCALGALRGLTLVNGRSAGNGGVVCAYGAGDVEIIESVVRDCSAGNVRRVELAASCSAARQRGERWRGPRLPHPALSSQPQDGGVVSAANSGAVSIIGSDVTGCSAGGVRRVELAALLQSRTAAGREIERAAAASPRSLLATAGGRRRLRVSQRCGLAKGLARDGLLG